MPVRNPQGGFTLLELLIVFAIGGLILCGIIGILVYALWG
jgi:prepilin-type N-terminal cleavage/methylation domain-containing protein